MQEVNSLCTDSGPRRAKYCILALITRDVKVSRPDWSRKTKILVSCRELISIVVSKVVLYGIFSEVRLCMKTLNNFLNV